MSGDQDEMLALRARDRDGRGRRVDLAMYDALLSINERLIYTLSR